MCCEVNSGFARRLRWIRNAKLREDINWPRELLLRFPEFAGRKGLRRMNSGQLAVFYLVAEVVRVLQVASDPERWL